MNIIRCQLFKLYPNAVETFGYITKANRQNINLPKDHHYDACVIASEGKPIEFKQNATYVKRHIPVGDYQQTKGVRSEKRIPTGKICGFLKFDKVKYKNHIYFIKGRRSVGNCVLMDIYGNVVNDIQPKNPKLSNLYKVSARSSVITICENINI